MRVPKLLTGGNRLQKISNRVKLCNPLYFHPHKNHLSSAKITSDLKLVFSKHECSAISDCYGKLNTELCMVRRYHCKTRFHASQLKQSINFPDRCVHQDFRLLPMKKLNISLCSRVNQWLPPAFSSPKSNFTDILVLIGEEVVNLVQWPSVTWHECWRSNISWKKCHEITFPLEAKTP